jgi:hypothetical protein
MSDPPENLISVYLRRIDQKVDGLADALRELKQRVGTVEIVTGNLAAVEASHYASLAGRLDRRDDRMERIERRLGRIDEPAA